MYFCGVSIPDSLPSIFENVTTLCGFDFVIMLNIDIGLLFHSLTAHDVIYASVRLVTTNEI